MAKTSKFSVQEAPTALPGHCLVCRNSKGPFVNPVINLKLYGFVIICQSCINEMHNIFPAPETPEVEEPEPVPTVTEEEVREHTSSIVASLGALTEHLEHFRDYLSISEESGAEPGDGDGLEESSGQDGGASSEPDTSGISGDSSDESGDIFGEFDTGSKS